MAAGGSTSTSSPLTKRARQEKRERAKVKKGQGQHLKQDPRATAPRGYFSVSPLARWCWLVVESERQRERENTHTHTQQKLKHDGIKKTRRDQIWRERKWVCSFFFSSSLSLPSSDKNDEVRSVNALFLDGEYPTHTHTPTSTNHYSHSLYTWGI